MPTVTVEPGCLRVGRERVPLVSGEVHYWRLNPAIWGRILDRCWALGLRMLSTYVPWQYHEDRPGHFDFTGATDGQRALTRYLELLAARGFWVIIRPGPYIYSEWVNDGVPDEAYRYHRLHPTFLGLARRYLEAVCAVLRPHLASRGGRILLVQADNEVDPRVAMYGEQLGLNGSPGLFQEFLQERYRTIARLNDRWETRFRRFGDVEPFASPLPAMGDPRFVKRHLDFVAFTHWFSTRCARWMVQTYRRLGVDVPILLNTYPHYDVQSWRDLQGVSDLVGVDLYPTQEFRGAPDEHRDFLEKVRYLRTFSTVPFIAEFESGVWHGWHERVGPLGANHYRLLALSAMAAGVHGWNWYMLVNRDNWYMCPIDEWGRERPELSSAFRQALAWHRELDLPSLEKVTDTAVTFDVLQARTRGAGDAVLAACYEADLDYEFFDLATGKIRKPLLLYAGEAWLPRRGQERLVAYVRAGGTLVCFETCPVRDEAFRPCNLLQCPEPTRTLWAEAGVQVELAPGVTARVDGSTACFRRGRGRAILARRASGERYPIGVRRAVGKGSVWVIGARPSAELLLQLHRALGVTIPSRALVPGVTTAFFRRGEVAYVVLVNNGHEARRVQVQLDARVLGGRPWRTRVVGSPASRQAVLGVAGELSVDVPRKDGVVVELAPAGRARRGRERRG